MTTNTGEVFADLPDHLRPHAYVMLDRFVNAYGADILDRIDAVSAISSSFFRPILEQEAKLSSLGLIG